ncbi:uncharacterized protein LOC124129220 isoform X1 [Haliotis rufescens]|uniref:uncharacterized protein LOC124129220 isoform X1 n=1 Tax=Haliotis rufescens TaxID=6454 RepID=UPI00201F89A6|nr:uncharacterized protein LOC124129220 isoform X1 [Haliotis rufescens]
MTTVGIRLSVGQLAVYMMLIGFDNMDQIQAFDANSGLCVKAKYTTAENDCKDRSNGIFNISDFATSEGGRQAQDVVANLTEIWIRGNKDGLCLTYFEERGATNGSALNSTNTTTPYKFQNASCDDLHYYVCKRSASKPKNGSKFPYDVTCPESQLTSYQRPTIGFKSPLIISMVCIFVVLVIGIIAVYLIVKREKNGKTNGTPSQAGDALYMRSNPADNRESGLHTEGNEAGNHDSLTSVQAQGPLGAEDEGVDVVVVQCEDPREADDLHDNPLYVPY